MARSSFKKMVWWGAILLLLVVVTIFVIKFFKLYEGAKPKPKAKAKATPAPAKATPAPAKATPDPNPQPQPLPECTKDKNTGKPDTTLSFAVRRPFHLCEKDFCDLENNGRRYTCDLRENRYKPIKDNYNRLVCPGVLQSDGNYCQHPLPPPYYSDSKKGKEIVVQQQNNNIRPS
jgi:hypothetical protein